MQRNRILTRTMALEQKLSLKLAQKLVMTPSLQQAIKLLQMNRLELEGVVSQELVENPVLEEGMDSPGEDDGGGEKEAESASETAEAMSDIDLDAYFGDENDNWDGGSYSASMRETREGAPLENMLTQEDDLYDQLQFQLHMMDVDPLVREIAELIIGNLDADGFLAATVEEIQALGKDSPNAVPLNTAASHGDPSSLLEAAWDGDGPTGDEDLQSQAISGEALSASSETVGRDAEPTTTASSLARESSRWDETRELRDGGPNPTFVGSEIADGPPSAATTGYELRTSPNSPWSRSAALGESADRIGEQPPARSHVPALGGVPIGEDLIGEAGPRVSAWAEEGQPSADLPHRADSLPEGLDAAPGTDRAAEPGSERDSISDLAGIAVQPVMGYARAAVESALSLVRSLDPPGVASNDLRECLLLQLQRQGVDEESLAWRLIDEFWDEFKHRKFEAIARQLGVPLKELQPAVQSIQGLETRPGRRYNNDRTHYVEPDVHVVKVSGSYVIQLNDDGMPRLRVSRRYRKLLSEMRQEGSQNDAKQFIQEKMRSAIWLIKSLDQRQRTIYKVAESIVKQQRAFLDYGIEHLRPMVLRDVADDIEMHESTVSRVVSNKYIHTPRGLFPMKFFFHSGIDREYGGDISSLTVKRKIQGLIREENPKKPLSDSELMRILKRDGIQIARRTVAKYRDELGIPSSTDRKKIF